ncbi:hypothetical protein K1T71_013686 [Dendrolimus kikuchii]|uniref:Uncharacterized protein n=1 Tax=Dendrolimus kikuchii TaxID=765133 RepID=A0ACC1CH71_9NEOP|nr:hypothetical protein K1T71_013686 [Dendrolimus kikuchii]
MKNGSIFVTPGKYRKGRHKKQLDDIYIVRKEAYLRLRTEIRKRGLITKCAVNAVLVTNSVVYYRTAAAARL